MKRNILILVICIASMTSVFSCKKESSAPSATGTITLLNNSANPYNVYVNGALAVTSMEGETVKDLDLKPIGSYSIRVLQVNGYAFYPTDLTFSGTLAKGGTLFISFPN